MITAKAVAVGTTAGGVQRVYPLAYWGIFSSSETDALRKCPNKLRLFLKSLSGSLRLNSDSSHTLYNKYSGYTMPTSLNSFADILLHTLQLVRKGFHIPAYLLVGYPGVYLGGLYICMSENTAHGFDRYAMR